MSDSTYSVIFAGTPQIAAPSLQALIDDPAFDVQLVITQPDKPVGRKKILTAPPVKEVAQKAGIEVAQPEDINLFPLSSFHFHFLVVVAYGQILKRHILDAPRIAAVNLHPSLLPRWRGPSPMKSAILHGDAETGVTIQRMVEKLDAGPILSQIATPIEEHETIEHLQHRLMSLGATLLVDTLQKPLTEIEQDPSNVTISPKMKREHGNVDPTTMTAQEIDRRVRALVPWPGVQCTVQGHTIKLIETQLQESNGTIPLNCKDSTLFLKTVQPPGKTAISATDWLRGLRKRTDNG